MLRARPDAPRPRIVAHRGATKRAAENTLKAFRTAIATGVDSVEFDVQCTRDGDAVVIHDFDLSRTTDGHGLVRDTPTKVVRSLDASSWFDNDSTMPQRVPLLDEVLGLEDVSFEMELKSADASFVGAVLDGVDRLGARSRIEFTSPFVGALIQVRRHAPDATIGLFCRRPGEHVPLAAYRRCAVEDCVAIGADVLHIPVDLIDEEWVAECRTHGVFVHAANVDDATDLRRIVALGVDQLSTNDCELAVKLRQENDDRA